MLLMLSCPGMLYLLDLAPSHLLETLRLTAGLAALLIPCSGRGIVRSMISACTHSDCPQETLVCIC